jgi:hypothetical protein
MSLVKKSAARLSLESFKTNAEATNVKASVQMITGGALADCHGPVKTVA